MSGIVLLDCPAPVAPAVLAVGPDWLLMLADNTEVTVRTIDGGDMSETNCVLLADAGGVASLHPLHSWDITYPYARVAIKIRMDDLRPLDQLAQLVAVAPYLLIYLVLVDYRDMPIQPLSCVTSVEPPQLFPCSVVAYNAFGQPFMQLQIISAAVGLPARITLDITDVLGNHRVGWIGLRASRDGLPSGAML
jgi:hypothetical protein